MTQLQKPEPQVQSQSSSKIDFFKSPRRLEVENLFLRHQLSIALRRAPPRLRLRGSRSSEISVVLGKHPGMRNKQCQVSHEGFNSVRAAATRDKNSLHLARRQLRTPMPQRYTMKDSCSVWCPH